MIAVTLEYRPFTLIPWIRKIDAKFPSRWSELKPVQIVAIPRLQRGLLTDVKMLQIFLGIKKNVAKRIESYQTYYVFQNLKFIREPGPLSTFVIKNIMGYKAPRDRLEGVSFGAFMFGDTYYQNYIGGKLEDLNRFIASFYTDKKGFAEDRIQDIAKIIKVSDPAKREAIAINYALIRAWLRDSYPWVFQKADEMSESDRKGGWVGVFDRLVKDDLANQDKYAKLPVSAVLRHLNIIMKEYYKYGGKV